MDYEITTIDNKEDLLQYSDVLWDIIQLSYEPLGGCKSYKSYTDFKRNLKYARIAFSGGDVIACSLYRTYANDDSKKMIAIGSDGSVEGKQAVRDFIIADIFEKDLHYWVEASDAVEHLFIKYNGYPVPNIFASDILKMSRDKIKLDKDGFHYYRQLDPQDDFTKKAIFGFRSEAIYRRVLEEVDDYESFRELINNPAENNLTESDHSYAEVTRVKNALYNIDKVLDFYQDDHVREFPPRWKDMLKACVGILQTSKAVSEFKSSLIEDYIDLGNYLLSQPTLELHELNIEDLK